MFPDHVHKQAVPAEKGQQRLSIRFRQQNDRSHGANTFIGGHYVFESLAAFPTASALGIDASDTENR